METTDFAITVDRREAIGKSRTKKLRRLGMIPAIVYGGGLDPMAITVEQHSIQELMKQGAGANTIFLLKLRGTDIERRAMIKDHYLDPITRQFRHLDFIRVTRGHKLQVNVPLEMVGDSVGARHGGILDFMARTLQVEVLPREVPGKLVVDITELDLGDKIRVKDLEDLLPPSAKFLADPTRMVAVMNAPRGGPEDEEEEEELAAVSAPTEPELIRKGKGEEDGESTSS